MSVTPPSAATPPPGTPGSHSSPSKQSNSRWGTISGAGVRSPPPAPSSGASVRRNHTIHGARQHDKPRLEKHFEQPEDHEQLYTSSSHAAGFSSPGLDGAQHQTSSSSSSYAAGSSNDPLLSPSASSDITQEHFGSLAPLQALYSKTQVSRNNSLPTRHSSRLSSHMPASATQGRSSLFNSLSAITGGSDHDEHDWEKMIRAGGALGDDSKDSEEETLDTPWTDTLFMHKRFPSAANPTQPRSPIAHSDHLFDGHHRSGSSSAMDAIDQGFSASSPLGASFLRRHQSLNHHHSGRSAGQRLAARSSDMLHQPASAVASTSISAQIEQALSPQKSGISLSAASSPIAPSNYGKAPWGQPGSQQIGSPSRFANSFPSPTEGRLADQQQHHREASAPGHGRLASSDSPSGSLMEIHANLSKLDIRGSFQPIRSDPPESSNLPHGLPRRPELQTRSSASDIQAQAGQHRKLPSLITNRDALARGAGAAPGQLGGPISAAAFVPPIGHGHSQASQDPTGARGRLDNDPVMRLGPFTAAPSTGWQEKEHLFGRPDGMVDPGHVYRAPDQWGLGLSAGPQGMDPNTLALSLTLAQEQQRTALMQAQAAGLYGMRPMDDPSSITALNRQLRGATSSSFLNQSFGSPSAGPGMLLGSPGRPSGSTPLGVPPPSLAPGFNVNLAAGAGKHGDTPASIDPSVLTMQKGYNPAPGTFDLNPPAARFFVIKSYTEDDVHKSLKYEIWASTDKGNQRLDKAFRESAHLGPIYLFFSVNASGHFCGMAQMLTPLDYTTSSNVWAQDGKWKGTFKVRWIYVKDLPNNQLRHIRLHNTPEVKPVTQSRDTQELTGDAGREVLRIMADYQASTSLLQDYLYYELQSQQQAAIKDSAGGAGVHGGGGGAGTAAAPSGPTGAQPAAAAQRVANAPVVSLPMPPSQAQRGGNSSGSGKGVENRNGTDAANGSFKEGGQPQQPQPPKHQPRRTNDNGGSPAAPSTPSRNGRAKLQPSPLANAGRQLANAFAGAPNGGSPRKKDVAANSAAAGGLGPSPL